MSAADRRTVCDVGELPTLAALVEWAVAHRAAVTYQGPDLQGHPVYAARRGPVVRVVVVPGHDPHPHPLEWRSPLETLPEDTPPAPGEAFGWDLAAPPPARPCEMPPHLLAAIRSAL